MRLVVQRVQKAKITVDNHCVANIDNGLLVLIGINKQDGLNNIKDAINKILTIRIMPDKNDKMNLSVAEVNGSVLLIPQFTLYADTSGRRPYFGQAAPPQQAKKLYHHLVAEFKKSFERVQTGVFGAYMNISATLDGPVTIIMDV